MSEILGPLLAILALVVPLGLAYVLVGLQARSQDRNRRKNTIQREMVTVGKKKRLAANKPVHDGNRYI